jgi:DNA-binding MarR family transcriptional regulator
MTMKGATEIGPTGATGPGRKQLRLESFLPYVLTRLADSMRVEMPVITANDYAVSVPEWRLLAILAQHGTLSAHQIVVLASMEKSTVSRTVKGLSERGLVRQRPASVDNRSKDLALTRSGEALYRRIAPQVLDWEKDLLQGLEVAEYRDLLYLLDKLSKRMEVLAA